MKSGPALEAKHPRLMLGKWGLRFAGIDRGRAVDNRYRHRAGLHGDRLGKLRQFLGPEGSGEGYVR